MSFIGNPQDVLTTSSTLNGQFSPEDAVAEQALNRKRLISNLLMQQGLQGAPAGQMVGRFYVPSSPLQGASHLLQAGMGAYLGSKIDDQQKALAATATNNRKKVVQAFLDAMKPKQVMDQVPQPSPTAPAPPAMLPAQAQPDASLPTEPFRGIAPRPEGPYSGEVGAAAMPDVGVQSDKPPLPAQPFPSIAGQENLQGLDMGNVQPADMSQFANPSGPAPQASSMPPPAAPPAQAAPMPAPQPTMRTIAPSPEDRYAEIVKLITNSDPYLQRFGAMEFQRMQQENEHNAQRQALQQERQAQRDFLANENASNRDVRREGIAAQAQTAMATLQGNMIMRDMAIQQSDVNSARHAELLKQQNADKLEFQKWQSKLQAETARQHDQTLLAIANMKKQTRGQLPAPALKMHNEELDAIGAAAGIQSDMASIRNQIDSGKLKLGLVSNLAGEAKNKLGMSDESSRNLASFKASLEHMRNESLRLNKGVQTEGDSQRAWNELVANINDPEVVKQRLSEIEALNQRAVNLRKMNIDVIRQNYGLDPMETSGYESQPAAIGANRGIVPPRAGTIINALPQGAKQIGTSGGKPVYQTPDGKKFIGE